MATHTSLSSLFTAIANAIRTKTGSEENLVADNFPEAIAAIPTGLNRLITNDENVTPTGTYATSTYYNTSFGVKIGYCPNGDIIIAMRGGSSTAYENIRFELSSAPDGVSMYEYGGSGFDTSVTAGNVYATVISGLIVPATISVAMTGRSSTYDYVSAYITITAE